MALRTSDMRNANLAAIKFSRIVRAASIYQRLCSGAHAVHKDGVVSLLRDV